MFARKNPKGVHFERWRHAYGCGKWFLAARCTATLEVFGTYPAQVSRTARRHHREDQGPAARLEGLHNEHASRQGRPPDRPDRARRIHLQRQAPARAIRAIRSPRRCWPTTRCWSAAASSITARAASSPRGRKSRTRWSTSAQGARLEPNQRTTTTELFDGLEATSQNHWPSLEFDVGVVNNYAARFLPAGFYYKTFIHPRPFWKHVFEPIIRQSAGLGKAPPKTATPTATNRPMPSATCWWSAAGSRACRPR